MKILLLFLLASLLSSNCFAQIDTIDLKDKHLITSQLKPGIRQYMVFSQDPKINTNLNAFSIWVRDVELKDEGGEKVFAISQHWYGESTDTAGYGFRYIYSLNKGADFAPIFFSEKYNDRKTVAFNWDADKITVVDTLTRKPRKGFSLDFKIPNFNWNLDIETFEMLPLAAGKTFAINFYDAGHGNPQYAIYKVTGSEVLTTFNNEKVDCWKLFTETIHNGNHYTETYWISKKGHEFLKEEDSNPDGYRYKIKMPGLMPGLLPRFENKG